MKDLGIDKELIEQLHMIYCNKDHSCRNPYVQSCDWYSSTGYSKRRTAKNRLQKILKIITRKKLISLLSLLRSWHVDRQG